LIIIINVTLKSSSFSAANKKNSKIHQLNTDNFYKITAVPSLSELKKNPGKYLLRINSSDLQKIFNLISLFSLQ